MLKFQNLLQDLGSWKHNSFAEFFLGFSFITLLDHKPFPPALLQNRLNRVISIGIKTCQTCENDNNNKRSCNQRVG